MSVSSQQEQLTYRTATLYHPPLLKKEQRTTNLIVGFLINCRLIFLPHTLSGYGSAITVRAECIPDPPFQFESYYIKEIQFFTP